MAATERRRLTVNLSVDDLTWLEKEAADEGVEPVMLLGMIVARMRQGRPALYRQALEPKTAAASSVQPREIADRRWLRHRDFVPPQPRDIADGPTTDLADAADEYEHQYAADHFETEAPPADAADANGQLAEPVEPVAAVPLFIPERQRYNPGRN